MKYAAKHFDPLTSVDEPKMARRSESDYREVAFERIVYFDGRLNFTDLSRSRLLAAARQIIESESKSWGKSGPSPSRGGALRAGELKGRPRSAS